jgi:hypothetical protein
MRSIVLLLKKKTMRMPNKKPPIWAHQAIPLPPPPRIANNPEYNCDTNQKSRKITAGISMMVKMNRMGTRLAIRE